MAKKGVVKGRLLQIVSVTTQVDILRNVSRFKLQVRDSQSAGRSPGGVTYLLLCLVVRPSPTHPVRDGASFLQLTETPPAVWRSLRCFHIGGGMTDSHQ